MIIKHFRLFSVAILAGLSLLSAQPTFARGGGHEPETKKAEEPAVMDSMYSAKEGEVDPLSSSDNEFDNMFSPMDLFTESELVSPTDEMKMNEGHNEHSGHQEVKVEIAEHEQVSSSSKGFWAAVGITLFTGIFFTGLTIMRPGEN